jgi:hypothetical protein
MEIRARVSLYPDDALRRAGGCRAILLFALATRMANSS